MTFHISDKDNNMNQDKDNNMNQDKDKDMNQNKDMNQDKDNDMNTNQDKDNDMNTNQDKDQDINMNQDKDNNKGKNIKFYSIIKDKVYNLIMLKIKYIRIINNLFLLLAIINFNLIYYLYHKDRFRLVKNIAERLQKHNIIYIKLFQAISNNTTILTNEEQNYLIKYTDNVEYKENEIDYVTLYHLTKNDNIIINFTPINCGVVALVFKGFYMNNKIIVKMMKKGVAEKMQSAINEFEFLFWICSFIPYIKELKLHILLRDNKEVLLEQLDFKKEISNQKKFYDTFNHLNWVRIPFLYHELCENYDNLIVMEYINGMKYKTIIESKEDSEACCHLIFKLSNLQLFYNMTHADLHSGNFMLIKNTLEDNNNHIPEYDITSLYQLVIIDFGICVFPSKENQEMYFKFSEDILINKQINTPIFEYNIVQPKSVIEKLTAEEKTFIQVESNRIFNEYVESISISPKMLIDFAMLLSKFDLRFTSEFNRIMLSLGVTNESTQALSPNCIEIGGEELQKFRNLQKILDFDI